MQPRILCGVEAKLDCETPHYGHSVPPVGFGCRGALAPLLVTLLLTACDGRRAGGSGSMPSVEFLFSLGALVFLALLFGGLVWNRSQQRNAQRRTQELLDKLNESHAQTRDLQIQLTERKHTEASLMRLGNLKRLIARLSSEFVRMDPNDLDDGLSRTLAAIGGFLGVRRAAIFLMRPDGQLFDNTHEWCDTSVSSRREQLQGLPLLAKLPWLSARLHDFHLIRLRAGEKAAPELQRERHLLGQDENSHGFIFPMASENTLRGFMSIEVAGDHELGEDIVDLLKVVCEIFAHALDRQRTDKILRESELRYRELTELLPVVIFETDTAVKVTYMNRQGLEVIGAGNQLPASLEGFLLFAESERGRLGGLLMDLQAGGEAVEAQEFQCLGKHGQTYPAVVYASAVQRDGRLIGYRLILVDITRHKQEEDERRRLDTQFLQTQKFESLSVMAGSIAHNFNNLLTVVIGNLELILTDSPSDAPWMAHLMEADRAVKRAAELSSMMLTYVGKSRINLAEYDLSALVSDLFGMLEASLSRKITLELKTHGQPCVFKGDPVRIRQVIVNLLNNAAEAIGDQPGRITITTGVQTYSHHQPLGPINGELVEGEYVYLEVADDGPGMDPLIQERIFDPFFTTKFTGRGMGLAAVLGIVRAHLGGISLTSTPGVGTKVTAMFPRIVKEQDRASLPSETGHPPFRGSGKVLLVDDEHMILSVGERMLRRLGFDVVTAADGVEAMELFRSMSDDLICVVLDLSMPRKDGEEAYHEMLELRPDAVVIIASGYAQDQIGARFQARPPAGYIRKPYQLKDLSRVLAEALGD